MGRFYEIGGDIHTYKMHRLCDMHWNWTLGRERRHDGHPMPTAQPQVRADGLAQVAHDEQLLR
eukprot:1527305-Pyramimonas_sp.AAC.1